MTEERSVEMKKLTIEQEALAEKLINIFRKKETVILKHCLKVILESFTELELQCEADAELIYILLSCLLSGFIPSLVGSAMGNMLMPFGNGERPKATEIKELVEYTFRNILINYKTFKFNEGKPIKWEAEH